MIDTLGMGGAETWLIEALRHVTAERGGDVQMDFLVTSGNAGLFDREARELGAKVHYVQFSRSHAWTFARGLRRILRDGRYTVIHDHQGFAAGWHFLFGVGLLPDVRIAHFHNAVYQIEADLRSRRLMTSVGRRLVAKLATHVVGTSNEILLDYGFLGPEFAHLEKGVLYCGFRPERFAGNRTTIRRAVLKEFGWSEDAQVALHVGRIDRSPDFGHPLNCKNTGFAVDVGIAAASRDPRFRLLFIGQTSPALPALQQRVEEAGMNDRIRFIGIRRDIEKLMIAGDALLFPSRGEGLGMVAVEAQAAGTPVLASTAVPREGVVIPELIRFRDLESGAAKWTDDLTMLLSQPRGAKDANRRVSASSFSIRHSVEALFGLYTRSSADRARGMRVLHIVDTLGMGGAETWMMEILRYFRTGRDSPPQIDFLATSGKPGVFDEEARSLGAKIYYVRFGRYELPAFASGLRRVLRRGAYDVLHDHQAFASGWHFLLAGDALPPIRIAHVHNPAYQVAQQPMVRRLASAFGGRLIARYATFVAGTSRQVLCDYGFDGPRYKDIPVGPLYCGFDPDRFHRDRQADAASLRAEFGWPAKARIVLIAGRLDQSPDMGDPLNHKNTGFAVNLGIEAARREPNLHFLFAGQPSPALGVLRSRIAEAGLSDRFAFAGIRTDIERLMAGSDLLLFPSREEGLGMVAVEAQAAGLPVLASSVIPREAVVVPDLVRFRDLADSVENWVDELLQMVRLPRRASDDNNELRRSPFSIAQSAEALRRVYASTQSA